MSCLESPASARGLRTDRSAVDVDVRAVQDVRNPLGIGDLPELAEKLLFAVVASVRRVPGERITDKLFRSQDAVMNAKRCRESLRRFEFCRRIGLGDGGNGDDVRAKNLGRGAEEDGTIDAAGISENGHIHLA